MKFHTNFWFLKDKKVIQPGKTLILGKKPEISLKVQLFGFGKKFVPLMKGFPNSGKEWREVNFFGGWGWGVGLLGEGNLRMSDFDNSNLFES